MSNQAQQQPNQAFNQQLQYSKSPILTNQQKSADRYADYSPLQNVNLSKYNFDYGGSNTQNSTMIQESKQEFMNQQQPYSKLSGVSLNRLMEGNTNGQQIQPPLGQRIRDASSNDPLRINPASQQYLQQNDLSRFQASSFQQPQLPPQPQMQPQNPILQNPQQLFNLLNQSASSLDPLNQSQNQQQYLQLMLQQQQQMQLMQTLINQSAQINSSQTQNNPLVNAQRQQQLFELQKLMKSGGQLGGLGGGMPSGPTISQQQQQPSQQQLLYQQLLQLQQQSQLQQPAPQIFNSQQFQKTPMMSEFSSQLQTPLETTRILQNQPQQLPQQHQFFVQNYSQLQENLNQYKKLVNYLEQIDEKKVGGIPQQQQQIQQQQQMNQQMQQQIHHQSSQSQFIGSPQSLQQQEQQQYKERKTRDDFIDNESEGGLQIILDQHQQKNQASSVIWPSQFSSEIAAEKSFTSPQNQGNANQFKNQDQRNQQQQQQKYEKSNYNPIILSNQKSFQESQLLGESKFIDGDYERENIEDSKSSGELTKESFTEQFNQNNGNQNVILSQQSEINRSHGTYLADPDEIVSMNNADKSQISDQRSLQNSERKIFDRSQLSNGNNMDGSDAINVEEKPIANNQLTFEELLEQKIKQQEQQMYGSNASGSKPKREFLRRSSNTRGGQTSTERGKSQTKYKYYADNFGNQQNTSNHTTSPKSANTSQFLKKSNTNESPSKLSKNLQKSNQKQPKQQKVPNRPHSQQQTSNQHKAQSSATARSRQQQISNNNSSANNSRIQSPPELVIDDKKDAHQQLSVYADDPLLSDRNSVAEFEMLEKECIAKAQQKEQPPVAQQQLQNSKVQAYQPQKTTEMKHQPKLSKQAQDQQALTQKQLDIKIKEVEQEISKFKKENKKVQNLQKECEQQLKRVTKEIEDFESKKEQDLMELSEWKKDQLLEIDYEREQLAREKQEIMRMREQLDKEMKIQAANESDKFLQKIKLLEEENQHLQQQLDQYTRRQFNSQSIQTIKPIYKENTTITNIVGDIQNVKEQTSQGISPVKFASPDKDSIHNQSIIEEEKEESDTVSQQNEQPQTFDNENEHSNTHHEESNIYNFGEISHREQQEPQLQAVENEVLNTNNDEDNCIAQPADQDSAEGEEEEEEDSDEDEFDLKFPSEYHGKNPPKLVDEIKGHDGKVQRFYDNGKKEVIFTNGVKREIWPDGYSVVYFNNNDIKQTFPDQKIVYYFYEAKTTQTTFPNGLQVFKFSNNQIEKHFADGTKEISFPDGTIKCIFPDGEEESIFPDGTIQKIEKSGVRIIEFPSGQRDILYPDGTKVREFEDGSIKKIYPDGRIEMMQPKTQQQTQSNKKEFNVTLNKHIAKNNKK